MCKVGRNGGGKSTRKEDGWLGQEGERDQESEEAKNQQTTTAFYTLTGRMGPSGVQSKRERGQHADSEKPLDDGGYYEVNGGGWTSLRTKRPIRGDTLF
jgi:hypothetical protein